VIAQTVAQAAAVMVPFSAPAVEAILSDLLRIEKEQHAALDRLAQTVQRMADAPVASARIHLEQAAIPGRSAQQVHQSLHKAADKLVDAIAGTTPYSPARAEAGVLLAVVLTVIGDRAAARHHAVAAYEDARAAAWSMLGERPRSPSQRITRQDAVDAWYRPQEWSAAFIGDPESSSRFNPDAPLEMSGIPVLSEHERIVWRPGAQVDFRYIAYAQDLDRLRGHSSTSRFIGLTLEQVLNAGHEPLASRFELQIEEEHRLGYFTGMED